MWATRCGRHLPPSGPPRLQHSWKIETLSAKAAAFHSRIESDDRDFIAVRQTGSEAWADSAVANSNLHIPPFRNLSELRSINFNLEVEIDRNGTKKSYAPLHKTRQTRNETVGAQMSPIASDGIKKTWTCLVQ